MGYSTDVYDALIKAAEALEIASDWNVKNVQVFPPERWALEAWGEEAQDGWCATFALARKLREIAEEIGNNR